MRIAAAPVSWGVFEPEDDVPPLTFLDDVVATGYAGTELGPAGYLGDGAAIREMLRARGLALVGAFLPLPFSHREAARQNCRETEALLELLAPATPDGALPTILLSDAYREPARIAAAGRVHLHPEVWLSDSGWEELIGQVNAVAGLCRERDFEVAFHPHGGSYVETPTEINRLLNGIDNTLLGLCLDTGHAFFGGDEPLRLLEEYGDAVALVHLKDVDLRVLEELKRDGFGIDEAWRRGVFCTLGTGGVDIDAVLRGLRERNYDGWIVVEQDRILQEGQGLEEARVDADLNRRFLHERGL